MKKIILLLLLLLLTGCGMQKSTRFIIHDDKSMDVVIIECYDDEIIDNTMNEENNADKTYSDEERWQFIEENYSYFNSLDGVIYEKYEKDDYKGYKLNIKIDNIDNITGDETNFNLDNDYDILNYKVFKKDGNKYVASIDYSGFSINEDMDYNLEFNVTLPVIPISHNAMSVSEDEKTLTWNLVTSKDGKINFEFILEDDMEIEEVEKKENIKNAFVYIICAVILVILILIVILILKFKKKKDL